MLYHLSYNPIDRFLTPGEGESGTSDPYGTRTRAYQVDNLALCH